MKKWGNWLHMFKWRQTRTGRRTEKDGKKIVWVQVGAGATQLRRGAISMKGT